MYGTRSLRSVLAVLNQIVILESADLGYVLPFVYCLDVTPEKKHLLSTFSEDKLITFCNTIPKSYIMRQSSFVTCFLRQCSILYDIVAFRQILLIDNELLP